MNISITNECNRRCEYCFQKSWYLSNSSREKKEMSLDTIESILDMMEDKKHFKVMGGEPLLYSDIFGFLDLVRKKRKEVTFISNISIDTDKFKYIIEEYSDVISGWLINTDYPDSHKELFIRNFKLIDMNNSSLSTTLLPNTKDIITSAHRLKELFTFIDNKDFIKVRISPMAPNHVLNGFYNYSLDIIKFLEILWEDGMCKVSFDCPLNACEIHPELLNMFDNYKQYIEYKNNQCRGSGPFDILVDNSVIYCSSTYDTIRLDNIFNYKTINEAKEDMYIQWKNYWKSNNVSCEYKTCEFFNPVYCMGLCPAKNTLKLRSL